MLKAVRLRNKIPIKLYTIVFFIRRFYLFFIGIWHRHSSILFISQIFYFYLCSMIFNCVLESWRFHFSKVVILLNSLFFVMRKSITWNSLPGFMTIFDLESFSQKTRKRPISSSFRFNVFAKKE